MFIVKLLTRLRGRTWPILQTAVAATAAWCLAVLVLPDGRPSFASIAAVICLGASHGQRGSKALQLVAGVVLGICVASALVSVIGAGPLQIGVMVALAMAVAVLLGGGELLTAESAVSAILIVSLDPGASDGFTVSRILEGLIGGGVALAVAIAAVPGRPGAARDPRRPGGAGRAGPRAGAAGGGDRGRRRDRGRRGAGRRRARSTRSSSRSRRRSRWAARPRRSRRGGVPSWPRSTATRAASRRSTTRSATRACSRATPCAGCARAQPTPETLAEAVRELARSVWSLAAAYDRADEIIGAHAHALRAGSLAGDTTLEVMGQVRSTAVDLRRAADLVGDTAIEDVGAPTEELLVPPSLALLLTKVRDMDAVAQVRSFNRTVTERVGALQDSFLARGRPLGASRVLWEIGDGTDVRALRARLDLDSGYLSRLLRGLEDDGLIASQPDPDDRRVRRVTRTDAGHAECAELDRRSDALAGSLLAPLGETQQQRPRRGDGARRAAAHRRPRRGRRSSGPTSDAARFCLESYFAELNARFDAGFDPAVSVVADPAELTEPEGVLLVARLRGEPVGNGALRFHGDEWAEIKRMWVADSARGLGVGRRILAELEAYARDRDVRVIRLETNRTLREAIGAVPIRRICRDRALQPRAVRAPLVREAPVVVISLIHDPL